jgi:hypothetical protein
MRGVGFEPTQLYATEPESASFDQARTTPLKGFIYYVDLKLIVQIGDECVNQERKF